MSRVVVTGFCWLVCCQLVVAQPKAAPKGAEVLKHLSESIDTSDLQNIMTLRELVFYLSDRSVAARQEISFFVDVEGFKEANHDGDVWETRMKFEAFPRRLSYAAALKLALEKIPNTPATYVVRNGAVEITTAERAQTRSLMKRRVYAAFDKKPLAEALYELSEQSGVSIVVDPRLKDAGKTPVSAVFRGDVSLQGAVSMLTDMAEAGWLSQGGAVYVTTVERAQTLKPKRPAPKTVPKTQLP